MAQGSIRIETVLETKAAKKNVEELYNELKRLKDEEKALNETGNEQQAQEAVRKRIEVLKKEEAARIKAAHTEREILRIKQEYADKQKAAIDAAATHIDKLHATRDAIAETETALSQAKDKYYGLVEQGKREAESTKQSANQASKMSKFFGSAKKAAAGLALAIGKKTVGSIVKIGNTIKNKIVGGLRNAVKHTDSMRKKFMKLGLALVGMRGIWVGIRQIVSSALANNEKLQKQLTATKGVLGTALTPAIQFLTDALGKIVTFIDRIYSMITGTSLIAKYNATQAKKIADSTEDAAKAAKEYNKQMASFDVANKLTDNNKSTDSSSSAEDAASFFKEFDLSGWMQSIINQIKNGNWFEVGETVAEKIATSLNGIDWEKYKAKAGSFGTNLANLINGAILYENNNGTSLTETIGTSLAEAINTGISFLYGYVDTLEWGNIGKKLADGFSAFVKTIDWKKALKTAYKAGSGITELLLHLFTDEDEEGDTALSNATKAIGKVINAITKFVKGAIDKMREVDEKTGKTGWQKLGESIGQSVIDGISTVDWAESVETGGLGLFGVVDGVVAALKKAFGSAEGQKAFKDLGGNIFAGIIAGLVTAVGTGIYNAIHGTDYSYSDVFEGVNQGIKDAFGINSPAKKMYEIGYNILEGVKEGILEKIQGISTWFEENVFKPINEAWDNFKDLVVNLAGNIEQSFTDAKEKWENVKEEGKEVLATIKGKIEKSFTDLKDKWDTVNTKGKEALAKIKGKIEKTFSNLKTKWDGISAKGKSALATIKGNVNSTFDKAKNKWDSVKNKTVELTAKFKDAVTGVVNTLIDKINVLINKLKEFKVGTIKPFKDLKPIPPLAAGGIVNNPGRGVSAIVGEAGPEAVLPLTDSVLSKLANMINSYGNGQQIVIPVYLDGKQIANYTVDTINKRAFQMNRAVIK